MCEQETKIWTPKNTKFFKRYTSKTLIQAQEESSKKGIKKCLKSLQKSRKNTLFANTYWKAPQNRRNMLLKQKNTLSLHPKIQIRPRKKSNNNLLKIAKNKTIYKILLYPCFTRSADSILSHFDLSFAIKYFLKIFCKITQPYFSIYNIGFLKKS